MPLNVAILTWEYPPRIVGEMAHYTRRLASDLVKQGLKISVITFHDSSYVHEKNSDGVYIHRVPNPVKTHATVVTWALSLTAEVQRIISNVWFDGERKIDLLDVHEWQFVAAAVGLKKVFRIPFVLTLHSLEDHRSSDPGSPLSVSIRGLEWLGAYECETIISKSAWMRAEVERVHLIPSNKIRTIASESPSLAKETLRVYREAARARSKW